MTTYSSGHSGVADYVTGLQTRGDLESCLRKHLEHDSDQGPLLVALGVDVIGLKQINDTNGFLAGDKHLAAAAAKLIELSKGNVAAFIFVINLFDLGGCNNLLKKGYNVENLMDFPGH